MPGHTAPAAHPGVHDSAGHRRREVLAKTPGTAQFARFDLNWNIDFQTRSVANVTDVSRSLNPVALDLRGHGTLQERHGNDGPGPSILAADDEGIHASQRPLVDSHALTHAMYGQGRSASLEATRV
jgi:hypothetical protein